MWTQVRPRMKILSGYGIVINTCICKRCKMTENMDMFHLSLYSGETGAILLLTTKCHSHKSYQSLNVMWHKLILFLTSNINKGFGELIMIGLFVMNICMILHLPYIPAVHLSPQLSNYAKYQMSQPPQGLGYVSDIWHNYCVQVLNIIAICHRYRSSKCVCDVLTYIFAIYGTLTNTDSLTLHKPPSFSGWEVSSSKIEKSWNHKM